MENHSKRHYIVKIIGKPLLINILKREMILPLKMGVVRTVIYSALCLNSSDLSTLRKICMLLFFVIMVN